VVEANGQESQNGRWLGQRCTTWLL